MQLLELTVLFKTGRPTMRSLPCSLTLIFLKKMRGASFTLEQAKNAQRAWLLLS